jgi:hypothetical protein
MRRATRSCFLHRIMLKAYQHAPRAAIALQTNLTRQMEQNRPKSHDALTAALAPLYSALRV